MPKKIPEHCKGIKSNLNQMVQNEMFLNTDKGEINFLLKISIFF